MSDLKLTAAAAALAAALMPAVHAADVSLYGVMATGLVYQNIENQNNGNVSMAAYSQHPEQPRFGIRAREDLGNGLYVGAQVESGFHTDTGSLVDKNTLFNRSSRVFIGNGKVEMSLGRIAGFTIAAQPYSAYGRLNANMTTSSLPGLAPANITYQPGELSNAIAVAMTNKKGFFAQGIYSNGSSANGIDTETTLDWADRKHVAQAAAGWIGKQLRFGAVYSWERQDKPDSETVRKNDMHGVHLIASWNFGGPGVSAVLYAGKNDWRIGPVSDTVSLLGGGAAGSKLLKSSKDGLDTLAGFVSAVYPMGRHELSGALGYLDAEWQGEKTGLEHDSGSAVMGGVLYRYRFSKRTYAYGTLSYSDGQDLLDSLSRFNRLYSSVGLLHRF